MAIFGGPGPAAVRSFGNPAAPCGNSTRSSVVRRCVILFVSQLACASTESDVVARSHDDAVASHETEDVEALCERCTHERCSFAAAQACATEAEQLLSGKDVPFDLVAHGDRAERACIGGAAGACVAIARLYQDGRGGREHDDLRGNEWLRRGCVLGDATACFGVGVMAFNGEHATADPRAAQLWFAVAAAMGRSACETGKWRDCELLGTMHERGVGVSADPVLAFSFYERACAAANEHCASLGRAKLVGMGSTRDVEDGTRLLTDACDAGADDSCAFLAEYLMTSAGRTDQVRAAALLERSCSNNDVRACVLLAAALVEGRGVAVDLARARGLLDRMCDRGDVTSCVSLAEDVVRTGNLAEGSKARAHYEAACRMADVPSCSKLAYLQDVGGLGPIDRVAARKTQADACRMGDDDACARLLRLGITPDIPVAKFPTIVALAFPR